ncbi:unnamed protein product [Polarella glacialis]|uniref:Uncharacterized protein n=2 Tax=Polarella glacialis TaxID=89957 RepID=A0A813LLJ6_POLGL|nr:unnamed protein product [Polarella glacialis]CAE8643038.1 unnamed protein product [Polarella glacialis]CAE8727863.1 unnamed protein product [Polarella glacialis]
MEVQLHEGQLLTVPMPGASGDDLAASVWKDLALRSPRPALHLLRQEDLDKAFVDLGDRMFTDAIFVRNERIARELGSAWASKLLSRCERGDTLSDDEARPECPLAAGCPMRGFEVMWCDSDLQVAKEAGLLEADGLVVSCFQTPELLVENFQSRPNPSAVVAILTSMMERGGRKERGEMNALDLFRAVEQVSEEVGLPAPVMGLISLSADRDAAIAAGADFVVYGNRVRAQQHLLSRLRERDLRSV